MRKILAVGALVIAGCIAMVARTHTVARGESLELIASQYNITVAQLVEANPGVNNLFYVGMKLNIPEVPLAIPPSSSIEPATPAAPASNTPADQDYALPRPNRHGNHTPTNTNQATNSGNGDVAPKGSRTDSNGETVYHCMAAKAIYMMGDFDVAKESSWYGVGVESSSISHWGFFHVGANVDFILNAGIVDDWSCSGMFGPSVRFDLAQNVFINMPINAVFTCDFSESDTKTYWAARMAPALNVYFSNRFGIFAGPQVSFDFEGSDATFGMYAGLTFYL